MNGQLGQTVAGNTLVLIAVHLSRSVEASMIFVCPDCPLNTVNSMGPPPETRGALSIGLGTAATRTATIFECPNAVGTCTGPVGPSNRPSIRRPLAELLTV